MSYLSFAKSLIGNITLGTGVLLNPSEEDYRAVAKAVASMDLPLTDQIQLGLIQGDFKDHPSYNELLRAIHAIPVLKYVQQTAGARKKRKVA